MKTFFALFIFSMCVSLVLTPIMRRLSERFGWLDEPRDARRVHRKAMSRLGGVAIFITVIASLIPLAFYHNLVTQIVRDSWPLLFAVLLPATFVFLLGVYDDLRGASATFKFIGQGLAATLFFVMGGRIEALGVPFVGPIHLPLAVSFIITLFWVIGITNAFNLIDGVDGLAAGSALFASLVLVIISLLLGHPLVSIVTIVLSGALIGFLRYNFNPASIFLGDCGALFVGFVLATLSIEGSQKASTAVVVAIPLLAFGLPVIDTGITILRRFISGQSLLQGDREHIHHMLLERGWSQRRVVLVLYGFSAFLGILALLFLGNYGGPPTALLLIIIGTTVLFVVSRLRYHEMDEVRASMRRNLSDRKKRAANNIRIRRASRAMSKAMTINDIFKAALTMLEHREFVCATIELRCGEDSVRHIEELAGKLAPEGVELREDFLCWTWERGDIKAQKVIGSGEFWTLRLPLTTGHSEWGYINLYREFNDHPILLDISYLCGFFRTEMTQAVKRVLGSREKFISAARLKVGTVTGN
ncbi:MAG: MraY family glycosyltransferase [Pyrinomonadaceae bacterium]